MSIVIGADFVPTSRNKELFINGNVTELVGEKLENIIKEADLRVFNLEMPLIDEPSPIKKSGPCIKAPALSINAYKNLNVNLVTIGNNHLMDHGEKGYRSTVDILNKEGIEFVGAGDNISSVKHSTIVDVKGKKVGVYACAEHEFSIATKTYCGANPYDPLESFDHVQELKKQCDFVIVLYHGGRENYRYPSPNQQRVFRKFVDKGADLVVGQHSHCICCEEKYNGKTLIYGQGNFVFDYGEEEVCLTSLLVKVNDDFSIEYLPLSKQIEKVRLAEGQVAEEILGNFNKRSQEITVDGVIEQKFAEHANKLSLHTLLVATGMKYTFARKVLNRLSKKKFMAKNFAKRFKGKKKLSLLNLVRCEAHNELTQQVMLNMFNEENR